MTSNQKLRGLTSKLASLAGTVDQAKAKRLYADIGRIVSTRTATLMNAQARMSKATASNKHADIEIAELRAELNHLNSVMNVLFHYWKRNTRWWKAAKGDADSLRRRLEIQIRTSREKMMRASAQLNDYKHRLDDAQHELKIRHDACWEEANDARASLMDERKVHETERAALEVELQSEAHNNRVIMDRLKATERKLAACSELASILATIPVVTLKIARGAEGDVPTPFARFVEIAKETQIFNKDLSAHDMDRMGARVQRILGQAHQAANSAPKPRDPAAVAELNAKIDKLNFHDK